MKKLILLFSVIILLPLPIFSQSHNEFMFTDINNNDVSLMDLLDKGPVLISFWAIWCSPCKEEMKKLQTIYEKYKDKGFTYLAINQDNQKSISKVKAFINANNYTFPVILDPDKKIFEAYSGVGIPYSLLITPDKNIFSKHLGYVTGDEFKMEAEIIEALNLSFKQDDSK